VSSKGLATLGTCSYLSHSFFSTPDPSVAKLLRLEVCSPHSTLTCHPHSCPPHLPTSTPLAGPCPCFRACEAKRSPHSTGSRVLRTRVGLPQPHLVRLCARLHFFATTWGQRQWQWQWGGVRPPCFRGLLRWAHPPWSRVLCGLQRPKGLGLTRCIMYHKKKQAADMRMCVHVLTRF
jgi:hypothetical protein